MKTGTKSVLFGAHQFIIHPIAMSIAWYKLYGFPSDPRLWVAFIVHDIGYIGKAKMDDDEGESHPELGAKIMGFLFGEKWHDFTLLHSRFYARKLNRNFSRLAVADKLATGITPAWIYVPLAIASGEVQEYMESGMRYGDDYAKLISGNITPWKWFARCKQYMQEWVSLHKHEAIDPW